MEREKVRIDRWLWAVRICKTRQSASEECRKGRVTINGKRVKPSRMISVDEKITVRKDGIDREYGVKGCIEKRVGPKSAGEYRDDLTPEEVIREHTAERDASKMIFSRPRGAGRPTKKDRRIIEKLRGKNSQ